jgi:quercetin dioxygenase-like cupin family protein
MATLHARSGELLDVLPFAETFPLEQSIALVRSEHWEVFRLVMPAGKVVPEHKVASVTLLQCIEGAVELTAHGKVQKMRAGHLVYLAAGVPHALKALNDASLLVTMLVDRE